MAKTLFDHIKMITDTQDPAYWDKLEDTDKKSWSNFMIMRYLSMNNNWIPLLGETQRLIQELEPRYLYKFLIDVIPKKKIFLKYISADKVTNHEKWLVSLLCKDLEVPEYQGKDYLSLLYMTSEGKQAILSLCNKYGIEQSEIKKLKLG